MEYSFFFKNHKNQRLFGILHAPEQKLAKGVTILYCSPIFEEKLHSHRVLVNFSRYAASKGIHVLRFDYYGDGESEGLFEEASIESRIDDIESAVEYVKNQVNPSLIILLGLRLGGTLAVLAGESLPKVDGIVAWSPIIDVKQYLYELLRINLSYQLTVHKKIQYNREALISQIMSGGSVNIEGYELTNPLFNEAVHINLLTSAHQFNQPVFVCQINEKQVPDKMLQIFFDSLNVENKQLKNFEESRFWLTQKRIYSPCTELFNSTTKWILSVLSK
jgi:exosortase A-associated hydrolase 2